MTSVGTSMSPVSAPPTSPWHSPVPYLFGGLAAMLGLIAFALLILACSYWKLSGYGYGDGGADRDLEAGDGNGDSTSDIKPPPVYEPKFLVIMAGQEKPTCLATPASSRTSSFGSNCSGNEATSANAEDLMEKGKDRSEDPVQIMTTENHESSHQSL